MGIRDRKQTLIGALRLKARVAGLTEEQTSGFELMYRRSVTQGEQDQVTQAFDTFVNGWKTSSNAMAKVRRGFLDDDDEDEDPPSLRAALARSGVSFLRT